VQKVRWAIWRALRQCIDQRAR